MGILLEEQEVMHILPKAKYSQNRQCTPHTRYTIQAKYEVHCYMGAMPAQKARIHLSRRQCHRHEEITGRRA